MVEYRRAISIYVATVGKKKKRKRHAVCLFLEKYQDGPIGLGYLTRTTLVVYRCLVKVLLCVYRLLIFLSLLLNVPLEH